MCSLNINLCNVLDLNKKPFRVSFLPQILLWKQFLATFLSSNSESSCYFRSLSHFPLYVGHKQDA